MFKGKIVDVLRETRGAFNFGKVVLEGIGDCELPRLIATHLKSELRGKISLPV